MIKYITIVAILILPLTVSASEGSTTGKVLKEIKVAKDFLEKLDSCMKNQEIIEAHREALIIAKKHDLIMPTIYSLCKGSINHKE